MGTMRSLILLLVAMSAFASVGTVLCEVDCVGAALIHSTVSIARGANNAASAHCHHQLSETARHDSSAPSGNSRGSKNHCGIHEHARIVATANARVQVVTSTAVTAEVVVTRGTARPTGIQTSSRRNSLLTSIHSSSIFATGVLRI
jgi:hypothetical protein